MSAGQYLSMNADTHGATDSIESTRFATVRKNSNLLEVYGDKGAVALSLERMNGLKLFDAAIRVFLLKPAGQAILVSMAVRPPYRLLPPIDRQRSKLTVRDSGNPACGDSSGRRRG